MVPAPGSLKRKASELEVQGDINEFSAPTSMVTLVAGDNQKSEFLVHKEVACRWSPVLKVAFHSYSEEGVLKIYHLSGYRRGTVRLLIQWMYNKSVKAKPDADMELVELWVLAESLGIPKLQNYTIQTIEDRSISTNEIPMFVIVYVYANTAEGSLLRRYFMESCALDLDGNEIASFPWHFPKEILIEMVVYLKSRKNRTVPAIKDFKVPEK